MSAAIRFSRSPRRLASWVFRSRRRPSARLPIGLVSAVLLAVALVTMPVGAGARADALDDARAQGLVGERFDGYLAVRDPAAPASTRQLVEAINAKRRQVYGDVAARQGANVDAVGRIYAREIVQKVPPGTWILQESGQWVRK